MQAKIRAEEAKKEAERKAEAAEKEVADRKAAEQKVVEEKVVTERVTVPGGELVSIEYLILLFFYVAVIVLSYCICFFINHAR